MGGPQEPHQASCAAYGRAQSDSLHWLISNLAVVLYSLLYSKKLMYSPIHQPIPAPSIVGGYTAIQQLYSYTAIQLYSAIQYTSYTPSLSDGGQQRGAHNKPSRDTTGSLVWRRRALEL